MIRKKYFNMIFLIFIFSSLLLPSEVISAESYPMICKPGGNLKLWFPGEQIDGFTKSPHAASQQPPGPGQCAWLDRPISANEPDYISFGDIGEQRNAAMEFTYQNGQTKLGKCYRCSDAFKYFFNAIMKNQTLYFSCYTKFGSSFSVTKIGP
jgi:hypothetical protein